MNPVTISLPTLIIQIISFLIVIALVRHFLAAPVTKAMQERQSRIREALEAADRARADAAVQQQQQLEEMNRARAEAQSLLVNAQQTADKVREEQLVQARAEATRLVEQARTAIAQEREQTKQQLRAYVIDLTIEAARRVVGSTLDLSGQHRLIEQTVEEVLATGNGAASNGGETRGRA